MTMIAQRHLPPSAQDAAMARVSGQMLSSLRANKGSPETWNRGVGTGRAH